MVLLTMTAAVVRTIEEAKRVAEDELLEIQMPDEPSLTEAAVGEPISHGQLIALSKLLRKHEHELAPKDDDEESIQCTLDSLLKGCKFYIPPPPPKKEPTSEYKALMARLRREEESRAYERMINPAPQRETFEQRFAASPLAHLNHREADFEADDVSYQEVHRQIVLIINVLVSVICCAVFIWIAARSWSAPKRLGLSMAGSALVAIAEVVVYNGYVRRIKEAKLEEKKRPDVKEIIESWIIDGTAGKDNESVPVSSTSKEKIDDGVRYRKGKHR